MRNSVAQCVSTLSGKTFGSYDEVWGDNVVCRTVHIILALVNPDVSRLLKRAKSRVQVPDVDIAPLPTCWTDWGYEVRE